MKKLFTILCIFLFQQLSAQEYTIKNIHVITMGDDIVLENHMVNVSNGKITAIGESLNESSNVIDGKGAYLLPGLSEMHSHIPTTDSGDFTYLQDIMWLYLANGVLTVRGMIGHPSHLELKQKIASGDIIGPRIFAAGPSLNGNTVTSPESGSAMVKAQKEAGYDHLKIHPGLDLPSFTAIAHTAKEVDIMIGGHVPLEVGLVNTITHGYNSNEHMDGYMEAMMPDESYKDGSVAGPFSMNLVEQADLGKLPKLVSLTKEHKVYIAPTLSLFERFFGYVPADELSQEAEMKYMPERQIKQWTEQKQKLEASGQLTEDKVKPYLQKREEILMALHDGDVPILMSSDSPQVFNVPGFSIHHEIKSMSEAGMGNYEILKSGTSNVAAYFDKIGDFGIIAEDHSADFILVDGNPLEDLSNLKNIEGIMVRGKWFTKSNINQQLDQIEKKNKRE